MTRQLRRCSSVSPAASEFDLAAAFAAACHSPWASRTRAGRSRAGGLRGSARTARAGAEWTRWAAELASPRRAARARRRAAARVARPTTVTRWTLAGRVASRWAAGSQGARGYRHWAARCRSPRAKQPASHLASDSVHPSLKQPFQPIHTAPHRPVLTLRTGCELTRRRALFEGPWYRARTALRRAEPLRRVDPHLLHALRRRHDERGGLGSGEEVRPHLQCTARAGEAGLAVVVATDPGHGHTIAGVAREPAVAQIVGGAGLARDVQVWQALREHVGRAVCRHLLQRGREQVHRGGVHRLRDLQRITLQGRAVDTHHFAYRAERRVKAAVREGLIHLRDLERGEAHRA